jgi:hypothetical protein
LAERTSWWLSPKEAAHGPVFKAVEFLEERQSTRHAANLHHLRLYSNRMAQALTGQSFTDSMDSGEKIRLNVVKGAIDAATAQIATNRPRPMFLTERGNYEQVKRAERLGRFILGQFYALDQYALSLEIFRDACIFGTGFQKVYRVGGKICTERLLADQIIIDENESRLGRPRQLFIRYNDANRELLAERFPDFREHIMAAKHMDSPFSENHDEGIAEPCTVIEAFHLPSGPDADDGRHVISVSGATLLDEKWTRERFPIAKFDWSSAPLGYFGIGAAEEITPIQVEINFIAQKIQKLMTLATSMVWKEKGSFLGKIDNTDWAVREYTGKPPIFQTTASVSAEYFHHLDRLIQRAYELVGISQLSAQSKKPSGLDSGEALRVYNDIGTRRFLHVGQRWEQFHMDITELILDEARDIEEEGEDALTVLAQGDRDVEEIDFSDVSIEKNKYQMRVHPVSIIPDTPPGKVEMMQKLSQIAPGMGPRLVRSLPGIPDLEREIALETAPQELAELLVNNILEHGDYDLPDPLMNNLALTRDVAQRSLARAFIDGVPEERQELLRRFILSIDGMQKLSPAPMQPQPGAAGPGEPPAPPVASGPPNMMAMPPGAPMPMQQAPMPMA